MSKSKKPTGLSITRDGNNMNCAWKIGDKNYSNGQQFQYSVNGGAWEKYGNHPGKTATSKQVVIAAGSYYPSTAKTISKFAFRVRGNRGGSPGWSNWESKEFAFAVPNSPTVTASLTASNVTSFAWSVSKSASDARHYHSVEYQTQLRSDSIMDGNKITSGWSSATTSTAESGTYTATETTSVIATGTHTRWFRIRARGLGGVTPWVYAKHIYSTPAKATITSATASAGGPPTAINVKWNASPNVAYPIDSQEVQYTITTPLANLACPSNASWTTGRTVSGATTSNAAAFNVGTAISVDECMWVRVLTKHDENIAYSNAVIAGKGRLDDPSSVTVSTNDETFRATITATNNSDVPDSKLAIIYRPGSTPSKDIVVGYIAHGSSSVTVQCPDWSAEDAVAFGVYAYQGSEGVVTRADGVSQYTIAANMTSGTVWKGGSVAAAPTGVSAEVSETSGEVVMKWNWSWKAADVAEVSWSENINAWESTTEPSKYQINNLNAAKWRVSGLETGVTWYFRVRLGKTNEDNVTWGPYCDPVPCDLSSAPTTPALFLSDSVTTADGSVTASWAYTSTDGTLQALAEICEATISGETITYGSLIATTLTAQSTTLNIKDLGWLTGSLHYLCVRVTSESGHQSAGWSDPVTLYIAPALTCAITSTSLGTATVIDDYDEHDDPITREVVALTDMPLSVTVSGAGTSGTTTLAIERAESYLVDRPDESQRVGYEGETVYIMKQVGGSEFVINNADLIGELDDGAKYRIVATTQDQLGQTASASVDFEVHWDHQALIPSALVEMDTEALVAFITPQAPTGSEQGDTCDIYRLSADKPELIVQNAVWSTKYVDPYPTIGVYGGHRIVFRSVNGDYITDDKLMAWEDYTAENGYILDLQETVIDFGTGQVRFAYNMELSNQWTKEFTETKYLGGSVKGDWGPAVSRSSNVSASVLSVDDPDTITDLRRLAAYTGICHVRTPDGSSYSADVQVSETESYTRAGKVAEFSITITRVDPEELDGQTYADWYVAPEGATGATGET